ncbi:MAG: HEAT repeat domain-containing protein [Xenococcaceae cyanobacterium]
MKSSDLSWALEQIGQLGDPTLIERLQPLLMDTRPGGLYYDAFRAIVQLGGTAARDVLLPMLLINPNQDRSLFLLSSAADGIGSLAEQGVDCDVAIEPLLLLLADDSEVENVWVAAQRALVRIGASAVPFLLELLHPREDYKLQYLVLKVLGEIGDRRAEVALIHYLEWAASNELRRTALESLASIGGTKVEALLIDSLQTPDSKQRVDAICALAMLAQPQDRRLLELLESALRDRSLGAWIQHRIIKVLGRLGHPDAYPLIVPFAAAENEYHLRQAAFEALGQLGDTRGFDLIKAGLQDPIRNVEKAAIVALRQLGDARGAEAIVENICQRQRSYLYEEEKIALSQLGLPVVPMLLEQLKSPDSSSQHIFAMECLEQIAQNPEMEPALGEMLRPEIEFLFWLLQETRMTDSHRGMPGIAMALVRTGDGQAIDKLLEFLPRAPFSISRALALLEVNVSNRRVVQPLIDQLKHSIITPSFVEIFVKFQAVEAIPVLIEQLGRKTGRAMCGFAQHQEACWQIRTQGGVLPERTGWHVTPIRCQILEALTQLSGQYGLSLLFEIWETPEHPSRGAAGQGMGFLGKLAYPRLVEYLNHEDEVLCIGAIQALGNMGLPRAIPALVNCLDDARTSVRLAAIESLRWIGDPVAAKTVEMQLSDPDPGIQDMVRLALCRLASDRWAIEPE